MNLNNSPTWSGDVGALPQPSQTLEPGLFLGHDPRFPSGHDQQPFLKSWWTTFSLQMHFSGLKPEGEFAATLHASARNAPFSGSRQVYATWSIRQFSILQFQSYWAHLSISSWLISNKQKDHFISLFDSILWLSRPWLGQLTESADSFDWQRTIFFETFNQKFEQLLGDNKVGVSRVTGLSNCAYSDLNEVLWCLSVLNHDCLEQTQIIQISGHSFSSLPFPSFFLR